MSTVILRTATRPLVVILLIFAVILLLRGHDNPGGGFIGGLIAGAALTLYALALGVYEARRVLRMDPRALVAMGVLFAVGAGVFGILKGQAYLTHTFLPWKLPILGGVTLGTTLLFDVGVFLTVAGMVSTILFRLMEEEA